MHIPLTQFQRTSIYPCIVIKYRHAPQQRQRFCLALFIHPTLYRLNYKVISRRPFFQPAVHHKKAEWPKGGEIDIMERLNHDRIAYQTTHSYYTHVLGIKDNPPHGGINKINPEEYNIYSVDIYPDSLVFAVNHRHTYTYPRIDTDKEGQFPFYQPYYLLIDMQLGGSWVGAVYPKELPVEIEQIEDRKSVV